MKVLITRKIPDIAKDLLSAKFDVTMRLENQALPKEQLIEAVNEYDAILSTVTEKFTKDILEKSSRLRVISNYAAGIDNIDIASAERKDIKVFNIPDVVTNSTADFTFALLLAIIRKLGEAIAFIKNNEWKAWDPYLFLGEELHGKTFGIIGFGRIGQAVARRANGFGMKVIYHNTSSVSGKSDFQFIPQKVSIEELVNLSDYISIHLPLTPQTKHLINKDMFSKMTKKPLVLNMARGEIVKTEDLIWALRTGKIRGAGLDVTDPEPLPASHDLCKIDNCFVTPHIGTATQDCRHEMAKHAAMNILSYYK
jgi:glyoxylate reductase